MFCLDCSDPHRVDCREDNKEQTLAYKNKLRVFLVKIETSSVWNMEQFYFFENAYLLNETLI